MEKHYLQIWEIWAPKSSENLVPGRPGTKFSLFVCITHSLGACACGDGPRTAAGGHRLQLHCMGREAARKCAVTVLERHGVRLLACAAVLDVVWAQDICKPLFGAAGGALLELGAAGLLGLGLGDKTVLPWS